jgi:pterin-4a-carbinolamine dehydratase
MNPIKVFYQGINCSTRSINSRASNFLNRLPHYFFNYPIFEKERDSHLAEKFKQDNQNYTRDMKAIEEYKKKIVIQDWKINEEKINYILSAHLYRELSFDNREHALIFMNIIKDKCEEIDHHPEWSLGTDNVLRVRLTSHYLNNNLSPKDYELAAFISQKYEEKGDYNFKYNKTVQRLVSYSFSGVVALLSFAVFYYTYVNFNRRNTTSYDFYLAKVNHTSNQYKKRDF